MEYPLPAAGERAERVAEPKDMVAAVNPLPPATLAGEGNRTLSLAGRLLNGPLSVVLPWLKTITLFPETLSQQMRGRVLDLFSTTLSPPVPSRA